MREIFHFLLFIVQMITATMCTAMFVRAFARSGEERLERRVEEHIARDPIDQGVENIMTFSVRGKTGFEITDNTEE